VVVVVVEDEVAVSSAVAVAVVEGAVAVVGAAEVLAGATSTAAASGEVLFMYIRKLIRNGVIRGMGFSHTLARGRNGIPQPDPAITKLEDTYIQNYAGDITSKLGKLSLSDKPEFFPHRPAFGTEGNPVTLWANYFPLNIKKNTPLYQYSIRVLDKKVTKEQAEAVDVARSPQPQKGKGKGKGKGKEDSQKPAPPKEAKGQKREKVIQQALSGFPPHTVTTELKSQVVSVGPLKLPPDNIIEVTLAEAGSKSETWFVYFDGPQSMDLTGLVRFVEEQGDKGSEDVFPKYQAEINSLNVVLGHTPRSDPNTEVVGRSRFFALDKGRAEASLQLQSQLIDILRGYVQAVRPATGRLLLNVNVTHGIFRKGITLDKLFKSMGLTGLNDPDKLSDQKLKHDLVRVNKVISKARIQCMVPDVNGKLIPVERTIAGLATTKDGPKKRGKDEKDEGNRPEFFFPDFPYTSPATTRFLLRPPKTPRDPPKGLKYGDKVTVEAYFKASKIRFYPPISCIRC